MPGSTTWTESGKYRPGQAQRTSNPVFSRGARQTTGRDPLLRRTRKRLPIQELRKLRALLTYTGSPVFVRRVEHFELSLTTTEFVQPFPGRIRAAMTTGLFQKLSP